MLAGEEGHSGFSWYEHKQEIKDKIGDAEAKILTSAGRGVVNLLIASPSAASLLQSLPGFTKTPNIAQGPQVYGTLDNVTVVRAPNIDDGVAGTLYCCYKGMSNFDAPIVYSPYMPLYVVGSIPSPTNTLKKEGLAAVWSGIKVVVPNFVSKIAIDNT